MGSPTLPPLPSVCERALSQWCVAMAVRKYACTECCAQPHFERAQRYRFVIALISVSRGVRSTLFRQFARDVFYVRTWLAPAHVVASARRVIVDIGSDTIATPVGLRCPQATRIVLEFARGGGFARGARPRADISRLHAACTHLDMGPFQCVWRGTNTFPPALQHLCLPDTFNDPLPTHSLPNTIAHLRLPSKFNQPLRRGVLPSRLISLEFGQEYNCAITPGALPDSCQYVRFGKAFAHALRADVLPTALRHLRIGFYTRATVGALPPMLETFEIDVLCESVDGRTMMSPRLRRLVVHDVQLALGGSTTVPLLWRHADDGSSRMPSTVTDVNVTCNYGALLDVDLPSSLQKLTLYGDCVVHVGHMALPDSLLELELFHECDDDEENSESYTDAQRHYTKLSEWAPPALLSLALPSTYPYGVHGLPNTLVQLTLGDGYDEDIDVLPASLRTIHFGCNFNHPLRKGVLPEGLLHVHFGSNFNEDLRSGVLPRSLRTLVLGGEFCKPFDPDDLPPSLETLQFASFSEFNDYLQPGTLPSTLRHLELPRGYDRPLRDDALPKSLASVRLPERYRHALPTLAPFVQIRFW